MKENTVEPGFFQLKVDSVVSDDIIQVLEEDVVVLL